METPTLYAIRVKGHLDLHWTDWFDGLTISHQEGGETLLTGPVVDQAALFGLLLKVRDLNLPLLAVTCLGPELGSLSKKSLSPDLGDF